MSFTQRPIVWSIAGSDCSGGAGIQADLKTGHNLGCEVCTIITANTAQNSYGVEEINAVHEDVLWSQLKALQHNKPARVIKIGMLANKRQVMLIADWIMRCQREWLVAPVIVYDPVAIASAGGGLTEEDITETIKTQLFPLVDVLTPNANEIQRLSGTYIIGWQSMIDATEVILEKGVGAVILKGGHVDIDLDYCVDLANNGAQTFWLASKKIATENSHGSGCTYASAVAALLAQGYLLRDAITVAKAYINQGLTESSKYRSQNQSQSQNQAKVGQYEAIWQGHWPIEKHFYPHVITPNSPIAKTLDWDIEVSDSNNNNSSGNEYREDTNDFCSDFPSCNTQSLGLYPVVDELKWIELCLQQGVKTIQLRLKNLNESELSDKIAKAVALGKKYNAKLFINDHWKLAIKHKAYGVHLGQEDIATANLKQIKQAGLRLGISTHGEYELLSAMAIKPSYIAVGAIYPTKTKDMTGQIQGLARLSRYLQLQTELPMVAIGGITLERAVDVWQTGVGSIAVVTAITEADDPIHAIQAFQAL